MSGRKETVLDLAKFVDKGVQVKLTGGRQVTGTLKGYDQLLNLVLDEAVEFLRGLPLWKSHVLRELKMRKSYLSMQILMTP
ncbi:sm-like protein LSM7 isoform X2 [Rhodamnia argentea]|uniref:Sm-like protein LSM7 isoform X2 n=1 Tax=Rhodamnia argentea TaxID=178133 RepID=A0ABM3HRD2_9MYRT|nr:sm-like protein LSM7 isoform X2 [Rhodamnia argentea]